MKKKNVYRKITEVLHELLYVVRSFLGYFLLLSVCLIVGSQLATFVFFKRHIVDSQGKVVPGPKALNFSGNIRDLIPHVREFSLLLVTCLPLVHS